MGWLLGGWVGRGLDGEVGWGGCWVGGWAEGQVMDGPPSLQNSAPCPVVRTAAKLDRRATLIQHTTPATPPRLTTHCLHPTVLPTAQVNTLYCGEEGNCHPLYNTCPSPLLRITAPPTQPTATASHCPPLDTLYCGEEGYLKAPVEHLPYHTLSLATYRLLSPPPCTGGHAVLR